VSNPGTNLTDPWTGYAGGNPMPTLSKLQGFGVFDHNIPFPLNGTYINTKMNDFDPVYMNQWNLNIQRQIGQNWLVTANYAGNNTIPHDYDGKHQHGPVLLQRYSHVHDA